MQSLRRTSLSVRQLLRKRGGDGYPGGWFGPGTQEGYSGHLFGEVPPPAGTRRKWESWELPCYLTFAATVVILGVGLPAQPDTRITSWAREEALQREAAAVAAAVQPELEIQ